MLILRKGVHLPLMPKLSHESVHLTCFLGILLKVTCFVCGNIVCIRLWPGVFISVEQSCPIEWYWVENAVVIQFEHNSALLSVKLFSNSGWFAPALKLFLLRRVFRNSINNIIKAENTKS